MPINEIGPGFGVLPALAAMGIGAGLLKRGVEERD